MLLSDDATDRPLYRRLILAAVVLLSHFALAPRFGLFMDDWNFVGLTVNRSLPQTLRTISETMLRQSEGRPIAAVLPMLAGWLSGVTGTLAAAFVLAWLVVTLNALSLWRLVEPRFGSRMAWAVALAFILSPVDLTRELIHHALILQLSVAFALAGMIEVSSGRERVGVALGALSLLTYESPYFLLAAAPLFATVGWKRRRWITYLALMVSILFTYAAARALLGETRVASAPALGASLLLRVGAGLVIGPLASFGLALAGPFRALYMTAMGSLSSPEAPVLYFAGHALLVAVLIHAAYRSRIWTRLRSVFPNDSTVVAQESQRAQQAMLLALVMLPLGYCVSFTHFPPATSIGMGMSVHLAASIPVALLTGAAAIWLCDHAVRLRQRTRWWIVGVYAMGMLATCIRTQFEFARAWDFQRNLYRQVLATVTDMDVRTRILVDVRDTPDPTEVIQVWDGPDVIGMMVEPATSDSLAPQLFRLSAPSLQRPVPWFRRWEPSWYRRDDIALRGPDTRELKLPRLRRTDVGVEWLPDVNVVRWERLDDKRIVHVTLDAGLLHRVDGSVYVDGVAFPTEPRSPAPNRLSRLGQIIAE